MSIAISTFVNSTSAPYTAGNLDPKRQRIMRLLAKGVLVYSATSGGFDYASSATRIKALITDAAAATVGMTRDQVEAARIAIVYGQIGSQSYPNGLPSLSASMSLIGPWMQLGEDMLDKMELILDYYSTGQS